MTDIKWQEPPVHGNSKGKWKPIADALRENPDCWALVASGLSSAATAHGIKSGQLVDFRPAGAFESRSVTGDDGKFDIYARFIGEVSA